MFSNLITFLICSAVYVLLLIFPISSVLAQPDNDLTHIYEAVHIDPIIVSASRLNIKDFINMVEKDETFYHAFANLRHIDYKSTNEIIFFNKKKNTIANYFSKTSQNIDATGCRSMCIEEENSSPGFYKKRSGEPKYYTAKLYHQLFFTKGTVCPTNMQKNKQSTMDYHIQELKKLIFSPGKKTEVPIIGGKTAIFTPKMAQYYDYAIEQKKVNNIDCHVFIAKVKDEYLQRKEDKTVIKYLETYFEQLSHQVIGRRYVLEYNGIFSFNVSMYISVDKIGEGFYVPTNIIYDGYWNVPFKASERCRFEMVLNNFKLPQ